MIRYLNIPKLPTEITQTIIDHSANKWKECVSYSNSVFEDAYSGKSDLNFVKRFVDSPYKNSELKEFVSRELNLSNPGFGLIFIWNTGNTPALFPAHTDFYRNMGLNYLLESGGNNVETRTYKLPDNKRQEMTYWDNSNLERTDMKIIPEQRWCIFNAQEPHEVRNIETRRLVLMVYPDIKKNMSIDEFILSHGYLII